MRDDTTFRKQSDVEIAKDPELKASIPAVTPQEDNIEKPYLDEPNFINDYFELGTQWKDASASFYPEIERIESYIKSKIDNREIENSQTAVKNLLKGIEKINNLKNETRQVVKLEVMANYIEFLSKNDRLKSNLKRYSI